jgi:hypothetical protein
LIRCVAAIAALSVAGWGADAAKSVPPRPIRVPVSISAGDPALTKLAELKASIGGAPARVVRLKRPQDDLLLLIVFDVVGDLAVVDQAKDAIVEQVQKMSPKHHVAILRAQDGLQVLLDPTADRRLITETIRNMPVQGKAAMLDTLSTALELADGIATKSPVRVALLYITDSDVRNYREDFTNPVVNSSDSRDLSRRFPEGLIRERISRVEESMAAAQTPLFFVHLSYESDRLNEAYQTGLLQLASAAAGEGWFCRTTAEIPEAIGRALSAVDGQYHVWLQVPPKRQKIVDVSLTSEGRSLKYKGRLAVK